MIDNTYVDDDMNKPKKSENHGHYVGLNLGKGFSPSAEISSQCMWGFLLTIIKVADIINKRTACLGYKKMEHTGDVHPYLYNN